MVMSKETNQMQLEKTVGGQQCIKSSSETMSFEMGKSEGRHMKCKIAKSYLVEKSIKSLQIKKEEDE